MSYEEIIVRFINGPMDGEVQTVTQLPPVVIAAGARGDRYERGAVEPGYAGRGFVDYRYAP